MPLHALQKLMPNIMSLPLNDSHRPNHDLIAFSSCGDLSIAMRIRDIPQCLQTLCL